MQNRLIGAALAAALGTMIGTLLTVVLLYWWPNLALYIPFKL